MQIHVAKTGNDHHDGTAERPLLTINHAAQIAQPGDTVIVHEGQYRECVNPKNAGFSDRRRIVGGGSSAICGCFRFGGIGVGRIC